MLLSFWDYLRQRTAESILLGIQDALASTDQPMHNNAGESLVMHLELSAAAEPPPARQDANGKSEGTLQAAQLPSTTEPRRRGRPRKHPSTP